MCLQLCAQLPDPLASPKPNFSELPLAFGVVSHPRVSFQLRGRMGENRERCERELHRLRGYRFKRVAA
jgi:hypothetical protein